MGKIFKRFNISSVWPTPFPQTQSWNIYFEIARTRFDYKVQSPRGPTRVNFVLGGWGREIKSTKTVWLFSTSTVTRPWSSLTWHRRDRQICSPVGQEDKGRRWMREERWRRKTEEGGRDEGGGRGEGELGEWGGTTKTLGEYSIYLRTNFGQQ